MRIIPLPIRFRGRTCAIGRVSRAAASLLGITAALVLSAGSLHADDDVIWPIDYYHYLSSSFGEPRPGRFHYGIDPKSGGVTGKEVYAIGDGYISHVRTSPTGYGKVVYLTLENGETAVYGHLSEFLPEIEDRLVALRAENDSYDVDLWLTSKECRVTAGQVIGWSGDSGSWGSPHLHLEIRDSDNNPVNPLDRGYDITDTQAPQIQSVALIPLDNASTVGGLVRPAWWTGNGQGREPLRLSGRIGIAATVWDTADGASNHMGVYDISLALDGETIFSKRYEVLSYASNGSGALDYLDGGFHGGSGTISALFRHPGNTLPFYEGSGIIVIPQSVPPTAHTLTITARDHAGNTTVRDIPVVFGEGPGFSYCGLDESGNLRVAGRYGAGELTGVELWAPGGDGSWMIDRVVTLEPGLEDIALAAPDVRTTRRIVLVAADSSRSMPVELAFDLAGDARTAPAKLTLDTLIRHDRLMLTITSDNPLSSVPVIEVTENGALAHAMRYPSSAGTNVWMDAVPLVRAGAKCLDIAVAAYDAAGNRIEAETTVDCTVLDSMKDCTVISSDSLMTVSAPRGSVYRNVASRIVDEPVRDYGELRVLSKGYRILVGEERLKGAITATIHAEGEPGPHAGLFYRNGTNGNGSWGFVPHERNGEVFSGALASACAVAIFEDTTPPVIIPSVPGRGAVLSNSRPVIKATVRDNGAGLQGSDSIRMRFDGTPVYGQYNPLLDTVTWQPRTDLPAGAHTIEITVTDQVGNVTTRSWEFSTR